MAELNELLEQAVSEAEGLSQEAAHAQETVERLLQLATSLEAAVETGGAEARARLEQLSLRLSEAEAELAQECAGARGGLQQVEHASLDLRERVLGFLGEARSDLTALRSERDELKAEFEERGEQASQGISRSAARVRDLEAAAEARLQGARQEIASFTRLVDDAREAMAQRREALVGQIRAIEEGARTRLEYLMQTYDLMAQQVQEQVADLSATLASLAEQVSAGVARRLGQDAVDALHAAVEPLTDAIAAIDDLARRTRRSSDERFDQIAGRVEDVTNTLERLRGPLALVKQHLR
jgi:chromosome segregation ATPase